MVKQSAQSHGNVKGAASELRQAEAYSNRACKCIAYLSALAVFLAVVLGISIYFMFFN